MVTKENDDYHNITKRSTVLQSTRNHIPIPKDNLNLKELKDINFQDLDEEVKNRMFSKVENLKNTWEEFISFEKYHKKVFSNNP